MQSPADAGSCSFSATATADSTHSAAFTPFSNVLGNMLHTTHAALFAFLAREKHTVPLLQALKVSVSAGEAGAGGRLLQRWPAGRMRVCWSLPLVTARLFPFHFSRP